MSNVTQAKDVCLTHSQEIRLASDHSLLITLGHEISRDRQRGVAQLCALIGASGLDSVLNLHPAYSSLLITFDPREISPHSLQEAARMWLQKMNSAELPPPERVEIPVCYGEAYGPDLPDVAEHTGLSPDEVVYHHSSVEYFVYFLGFSPGFPYLGELPNELSVPRLPSPRTTVPAGSVAIGGSQTGIYPVASPGGWRIIGRTPLPLFQGHATPPALLRMGDLVCFRPITADEYLRIQGEL